MSSATASGPAPSVGVASMAGRLRRVGLRRPGAILTADHERWHYASPIDPDALSAQYSAFVALVEASGAEILWYPDDADDLADSIFTYDPSFVVPGGAVLLAPGKALRAAEVELHERFYDEHGIPIVGRVSGDGARIEGGDCFWLDEATIAVGRGFRTNDAGIEQFAAIVGPLGIDVRVYDLPYLHGPEACLHLMSVVSPLDRDLALVHAPLVPTALYQEMERRGWELVHGSQDEFDASLGLNLNVLATGPRELLAIDGFPETVERMRAAGCEVTVFDADRLCIPCEGGPTCMTRPILRD